jgi:hypothetical protein
VRLYPIDLSEDGQKDIIDALADFQPYQYLCKRTDGRYFVSSLYNEKKHGLYIDDERGKTILKMHELEAMWQLPR